MITTPTYSLSNKHDKYRVLGARDVEDIKLYYQKSGGVKYQDLPAMIEHFKIVITPKDARKVRTSLGSQAGVIPLNTLIHLVDDARAEIVGAHTNTEYMSLLSHQTNTVSSEELRQQIKMQLDTRDLFRTRAVYAEDEWRAVFERNNGRGNSRSPSSNSPGGGGDLNNDFDNNDGMEEVLGPSVRFDFNVGGGGHTGSTTGGVRSKAPKALGQEALFKSSSNGVSKSPPRTPQPRSPMRNGSSGVPTPQQPHHHNSANTQYLSTSNGNSLQASTREVPLLLPDDMFGGENDFMGGGGGGGAKSARSSVGTTSPSPYTDTTTLRNFMKAHSRGGRGSNNHHNNPSRPQSRCASPPRTYGKHCEACHVQYSDPAAPQPPRPTPEPRPSTTTTTTTRPTSYLHYFRKSNPLPMTLPRWGLPSSPTPMEYFQKVMNAGEKAKSNAMKQLRKEFNVNPVVVHDATCPTCKCTDQFVAYETSKYNTNNNIPKPPQADAAPIDLCVSHTPVPTPKPATPRPPPKESKKLTQSTQRRPERPPQPPPPPPAVPLPPQTAPKKKKKTKRRKAEHVDIGVQSDAVANSCDEDPNVDNPSGSRHVDVVESQTKEEHFV